MREIDFEQVSKLRASAQDMVLLDCRAAEYWLWETIDGSANIRWKELERRAPRLLPDKNKLIVTFCQSPLCPVSSKSYEILSELGYTNLYEYAGGIEDWRTRGGKVQFSGNRVSEHSLRFPDQKFYGSSVGAYLIEDEEQVVLVDGPQFLTDANEDFILSFGKPIVIFMTHGPTGGVAAMLRDVHGLEIYLHHGDIDSEWLTCTPTKVFSEGFNLSPSLQVIHTPGHSPGSCCLYDRRTKVLYTGDHVQGESDSSVWDFVTDEEERGDTALQLMSLRKISSMDISAIRPFHYEAITVNPTEAIDNFLTKYKNK